MSEPIEHETSSGNIFLDLGFDQAEAENLKIRSDLMMRLTKFIEDRGMSQRQAAKFFDVHQPRINYLMNGKIGEFTIDALINMLAKAGFKIDYEIVRAA